MMNVTEVLESYIPRDKRIDILAKKLSHLEKLDVKKQFLSNNDGVKKKSIADQYDALMNNKEDLKVIISSEELKNLTILAAIEALEDIDDELGRVARMKYIEGVCLSKISEEMNISPRTVDRKIEKAKLELEIILTDVWLPKNDEKVS